MTTLIYTMITPLKNTVISREHISDFVEKERGIYFKCEGIQQFVNWSYIAQYSLIEE